MTFVEIYDANFLYIFIVTVISVLAGMFGLLCIILGEKAREHGIENTATNFGGPLVVQAIIIVPLLLSIGYIFGQQVEKELITFLKNDDVVIKVDNVPLNKIKSATLIHDLQYMHDGRGNRPTNKKINMKIASKKKEYEIELVRAQTDTNIYYLYINNFNALKDNELGRIRTKVFDN